MLPCRFRHSEVPQYKLRSPSVQTPSKHRSNHPVLSPLANIPNSNPRWTQPSGLPGPKLQWEKTHSWTDWYHWKVNIPNPQLLGNLIMHLPWTRLIWLQNDYMVHAHPYQLFLFSIGPKESITKFYEVYFQRASHNHPLLSSVTQMTIISRLTRLAVF